MYQFLFGIAAASGSDQLRYLFIIAATARISAHSTGSSLGSTTGSSTLVTLIAEGEVANLWIRKVPTELNQQLEVDSSHKHRLPDRNGQEPFEVLYQHIMAFNDMVKYGSN